jgi:hypothetical protein
VGADESQTRASIACWPGHKAPERQIIVSGIHADGKTCLGTRRSRQIRKPPAGTSAQDPDLIQKSRNFRFPDLILGGRQ